MDKISKEPLDFQVEVLKELKSIKKALIRDNSLKTKFIQGIVSGFATVVGATVVFSLLILVLKQFAHFQLIEPLVKNIIELVQKTK